MNNLKLNTKNIIVGKKVNSTKEIIITLLKADLSLHTIKTPDEFTNMLTDVFDTSHET